MKKWKCSVCGYIHEGPMTPDFKCPVCRQPAQKFVENTKEKWKCSACGYIHEGPMPPDLKCPVCRQPKAFFEAHRENC